MIPRVIVTDKVIGLTRDEKTTWSDLSLMKVYEGQTPFGILLSHLLARISDRIIPDYHKENVRYFIHNYNPLNLYGVEFKAAPKLRVIPDVLKLHRKKK